MAARFVIVSPAFDVQTPIPVQFTCNGANISPPLQILDGIGTAKSYTLIVNEPAAPGGNWVHWVMFNIPPKVATDLEQGTTAPGGAVMGINSYGKIGYSGPCPKSGRHRYYFKIWALDTLLDLDANATSDDVMEAMQGHMIATNQLIGTYFKK